MLFLVQWKSLQFMQRCCSNGIASISTIAFLCAPSFHSFAWVTNTRGMHSNACQQQQWSGDGYETSRGGEWNRQFTIPSHPAVATNFCTFIQNNTLLWTDSGNDVWKYVRASHGQSTQHTLNWTNGIAEMEKMTILRRCQCEIIIYFIFFMPNEMRQPSLSKSTTASYENAKYDWLFDDDIFSATVWHPGHAKQTPIISINRNQGDSADANFIALNELQQIPDIFRGYHVPPQNPSKWTNEQIANALRVFISP